jgi:hypothetical protein
MSICPALSGIDLDGKLVKVQCVEHECKKYVNVVGANPQTGEAVNQWDCADTWIPVLLVENSQQQRGTSAAIESLRNQVFKTNALALLTNDQRKIG